MTTLARIGFHNPTDLAYNASSGKGKIAREGHCRLCLRWAAVRPLTRHHLVPLAWFEKGGRQWRSFRNANANIIPVCRIDHDQLHHVDLETMLEARRMLRRTLTQMEIAFIIEMRGKPWFEHWYPR